MPLNNTLILGQKPKRKPFKVSDFEGLYITVTPTGSKLWHIKYRIDGREKRLSFGAYPNVTLAQACGLRDGAKSLLANAKTPANYVMRGGPNLIWTVRSGRYQPNA